MISLPVIKHTKLSLNLLQLLLFLPYFLLLFPYFRRIHGSFMIAKILCCCLPLLQSKLVLTEQVCRTNKRYSSKI